MEKMSSYFVLWHLHDLAFKFRNYQQVFQEFIEVAIKSVSTTVLLVELQK